MRLNNRGAGAGQEQAAEAMLTNIRQGKPSISKPNYDETRPETDGAAGPLGSRKTCWSTAPAGIAVRPWAHHIPPPQSCEVIDAWPGGR